MKRILLTTGGTGGHIFPALAIAEEIRLRRPEAMILFVGGQFGPEGDIVAKTGLDFIGLPVKGVLGRGRRGLGAAFSMIGAVRTAEKIVKKFNPEVVVGFGGYAAFASVMAGRLAGRTTAIHEQNGFPGMANRILGKLVDRIYLSIPDTSGVFPAKKTLLTGNPVRAAFTELYEEKKAAYGLAWSQGPELFGQAQPDAGSGEAASAAFQEIPGGSQGLERRPRLLIMGGSLGAKAINSAMVEAYPAFQAVDADIWHQTGQADYDRIRAAYREQGGTKVRVEPFINEAQRAYAWADLVLCRAGGSTVAELAAAGLPSILVPFPFAAQDHQRHNARFLEQGGAAVVLDQSDFAGEGGKTEHLSQTVLGLLRDRQALGRMSLNALRLAQPYAAKTLVDDLEKIVDGPRLKRSTASAAGQDQRKSS